MHTERKMVIDIHTHIFPDRIAPKTIDILLGNIKTLHGICNKAYSDATLGGLKTSMHDAGVDLSVVLPIVTNIKRTESINLFAGDVNNQNADVISFAGIHPLCDDTDVILSDIKEKGFKGIKLHPEFQKFYIDSDESLKVLKKAEELGLLVLIHSGVDIGIPPPVHCTPERLKNALKIVSSKNIIAAHLGGWKMWDDVEKHLVGTNINFDTAFIKDYISKEQFERIVKNHGADKILFGSDSPWENPKDTLDFIKSLNLTVGDFDKITYKNAKRLLSI